MHGYVIHVQRSAKVPVIPVNDPMGPQVSGQAHWLLKHTIKVSDDR